MNNTNNLNKVSQNMPNLSSNDYMNNALLNMLNMQGINNTNNMDNRNNFSSFEKKFQKEVVKCTVENFCKYLSSNGYVIKKNSHNKVNVSPNGSSKNLNDKVSKSDESANDFKNYNNCRSHSLINDNNPNNVREYEDDQLILPLHEENMDLIFKNLSDSRNNDGMSPHTKKKHYAKNMCNASYHREGRQKKAWLCTHTNSVHYARGKCRNCYLNSYHKVIF
jgi:hypothetical protein